VATWHASVSDLIESYRQSGADRGDLMSRLLAARDDEDQGLSDTGLADQIAVLMLAGGEVAGWDHLARLDLTARVVREALCLFPPAWVVPRTCTRPVTLAGRTLPPGSLVVFSPYILHRRADQYPQPTRFDPARWTLSPDPGTPVSPAARAVLVPRAFPVHLSSR
jgi:cytochrome P450